MTNNNQGEKICLVTGVGPGTGRSICKRFSEGGYRVAMLARNIDRLTTIENDLQNTSGYVCNVADENQLKEVCARISSEMGAPNVVIHNAVGGTFGDFLKIDPNDLRKNFEVNTMALLNLARETTPTMIQRGTGVLLATGNTSAYRGKASFSGFAPTKAAQRILLESIARKVGPMGVHAAYVVIDAVIDVEWARKMNPEKPDEFFANPNDIAEECFRIAHQSKSAWSSEVTIRPFGESW